VPGILVERRASLLGLHREGFDAQGLDFRRADRLLHLEVDRPAIGVDLLLEHRVLTGSRSCTTTERLLPAHLLAFGEQVGLLAAIGATAGAIVDELTRARHRLARTPARSERLVVLEERGLPRSVVCPG